MKCVARSMSCDGALILVDASQGVEAQTLANLYVAMEYNLTLLPVINKIDLPAADVDRIREEIDSDLGLDPFEAIPVSAKLGIGIDELLEAIVQEAPSAHGRSRRSAEGAHLRRPVRLLPRGGRPRAGAGRPDRRRPADPPDAYRQGVRGGGGGPPPAQAGEDQGARRRRRGIRHREHQGHPRHRHGRHHHRRRAAALPSPYPGTRKRSRWCSPRSTRYRPTTTRTWRRPSRSSRSTTRRSSTRRTPRRPWGSDSGAGFSGSSTSTSFRSGWSASTASPSFSPRPRCATASPSRAAR